MMAESLTPSHASSLSDSMIAKLKEMTTPVFRGVLPTDMEARWLCAAQAAFQEVLSTSVNNLMAKLTAKFVIVVDYSLTLEAMVKAGDYDRVGEHIPLQIFPMSGKGKFHMDAVLLNFEQDLSSEEIVDEMSRLGLRPGTLQELLAFGAQYPEEQIRGEVVALGSKAQLDQNEWVPLLDSNGELRGLDFEEYTAEWYSDNRFLAILEGSD